MTLMVIEPIRHPVPRHAGRRRRHLDDHADIRFRFVNFIDWSGLDIGHDRSSPVSDYAAPFAFTGELAKVVVTIEDEQGDAEGAAQALLARE
jgi:hypothetical protein